MKFLVVLTAILGGFGFVAHQFSFWSVIGVFYMTAMALVVLVAFARRSPDKNLKKAKAAGSQS